MKFSIIILRFLSLACIILAVCVAGCVSVPHSIFSQSDVDSQNGVSSADAINPPAKPGIITRIFEPTKAAQMNLTAAKWQGPIQSAKPQSKSSVAIQGTVTSFEHVLWFIGLACILGAVACFWFGLYIPGVKLLAGGVLIPIFATWFAYNYLWIIAVILIASAIGFLWAERNNSVEKALLNTAHNELTTAYGELCKAVSAAGKSVEQKL